MIHRVIVEKRSIAELRREGFAYLYEGDFGYVVIVDGLVIDWFPELAYAQQKARELSENPLFNI